MGGVVLDYEAKRILNQGIEKGRAEGIERGKLKILFDLVQDRLITVADAANKAGMSERDFICKMNEAASA